MIRATYVARIIDGLPLVALMGNDELFKMLPDYRNQFKKITRSISDGLINELQGTFVSDKFVYYYLVDLGVSFLCLTEKALPKKTAFCYLEALRRDFFKAFPAESIEQASRPYSFSSFDHKLEKLCREFSDSRNTPGDTNSSSLITSLNNELVDISRIVSKNVDDLVQRGEKISKLSDLSSHLSSESKKYAHDAKMVNIRALYRKYGPLAITVVIVILVWIFWKAVLKN